MATNQDNENVLAFGLAKAKKDAKVKGSAAAEIVAKNAMALAYLQQLSRNKGSAGKIPKPQRAQWAKNVESILKRIKASGFGVQDLFAASASEDFKKSYEDAEAYSKNLSAMQNAGSTRQIVGYKKYLEFIKLVEALTGEGLPQLVAELTEGVALIDGTTAIPDGCFELARQLEIIANRVGKKCGLIDQFAELARIRERHLCSGGNCVWPDDDLYFEEGYYTPMPGKTIGEVGRWSGEAEHELIDPKYHDQTIGSLRITEDDHPLLAEGKRSFREAHIEHPAARRLAKNAYFIDGRCAIYESGETTSGKSLTVSFFGDQLAKLPVHYAGVMLQASEITEADYIRGRYLIRDQAELSGDIEDAFNRNSLEMVEGVEIDIGELDDGFQLAIFLYPNERCDGLIPIVKLGACEWTYIAPLDARYISVNAETVVFPKGRPKDFPYQTESLMSYLKTAIASGELESDWEKSSKLLELCPLWSVEY